MNNFAVTDIIILVIIALGVTYAGHLLGGRVTDRKGFFQAGGSLPWWAVSASIIATAISSVTFISIPSAVFRDGGNSGYIQVLLGLMLGKVLIGYLFARPYYESQGINTTYDYVGKRIGLSVGRFSFGLGLVLSSINAGIKLLTTGLVLSVITSWSLELCIFIMVVFAVLWSWIGGLKTVIWTDLIMFVIFTFGAVFSIFWTMGMIDMSFGEAVLWLDDHAKLVLFDFSINPQKTYTIWAGIIGASTIGLALAGTQGTFQRIKACRSVEDARKSYLFASFFYLTPICMIGVGLLISIFYYENPLPQAVVNSLVNQPDRIFPYFITTEIPHGVSVIFIAAIFAAGISTLDTSLTEMSDLSITSIYEKYLSVKKSERHYLIASRLSLVLWGIVYFFIALFFSHYTAEGLLDMTFKLPNYLTGSLFATIILARFAIGNFKSYLAGFILAAGTVYLLQSWHVGFFWWAPVSGIIMILFVWALNPQKPEWVGVIGHE